MHARSTLDLSVLTAILSTGFLSVHIQPAYADLILPGRCNQGQCFETLFLGKTLLEETTDGKFYSVELASRRFGMSSEPSGTFSEPTTSYVYCSTTRPAHIFATPPSLRASDEAPYRASLLNPGEQHSAGVYWSSYPIYWTTCHNLVGPDFQIDESRARSLGYPLNLQESQIKINDPRDILN